MLGSNYNPAYAAKTITLSRLNSTIIILLDGFKYGRNIIVKIDINEDSIVGVLVTVGHIY